MALLDLHFDDISNSSGCYTYYKGQLGGIKVENQVMDAGEYHVVKPLIRAALTL